MLGIPIPEIFVAQEKNGKWSIVDGLQRVSTMLQLVGELKDKQSLTMTTTRYLPALCGIKWEDLDEDVQRIFKRAKLGVNIILTENSLDAQYELFQRLNTGGLKLEDQERVRLNKGTEITTMFAEQSAISQFRHTCRALNERYSASSISAG